jgi:hypothetical protein
VSETNDLTLRTVMFRNKVDDMGVVLRDTGEERVKVDFGDGKASGAGGWDVGTWVDRTDLTDVTEDHDLALAWGLVEDACDCEDADDCDCDDDCECKEEHVQ